MQYIKDFIVPFKTHMVNMIAAFSLPVNDIFRASLGQILIPITTPPIMQIENHPHDIMKLLRWFFTIDIDDCVRLFVRQFKPSPGGVYENAKLTRG